MIPITGDTGLPRITAVDEEIRGRYYFARCPEGAPCLSEGRARGSFVSPALPVKV